MREVPYVLHISNHPIQSILNEDDVSITYPIYRHPAEDQPKTEEFGKTVDIIRRITSDIIGQPLNHCLVQLYEGGKAYIGEHSDKTLDMNRGSGVVSVSFGATRVMVLTRKEDTLKEVFRVALPNNSIFFLGPKTNMEYFHSIRQDKRDSKLKTDDEKLNNENRISLTFRDIATFKTVFKDGSKDPILFGQGAPKDGNQEVTIEDRKELLYAFGEEKFEF